MSIKWDALRRSFRFAGVGDCVRDNYTEIDFVCLRPDGAIGDTGYGEHHMFHSSEEGAGNLSASTSIGFVIPLTRWRSSRVWMSRRSPVSWVTIARASRWTPIPTSRGKCRKRPPTEWEDSLPKPSKNLRSGSVKAKARCSLKLRKCQIWVKAS